MYIQEPLTVENQPMNTAALKKSPTSKIKNVLIIRKTGGGGS
jgi:hypothetical protein